MTPESEMARLMAWLDQQCDRPLTAEASGRDTVAAHLNGCAGIGLPSSLARKRPSVDAGAFFMPAAFEVGLACSAASPQWRRGAEAAKAAPTQWPVDQLRVASVTPIGLGMPDSIKPLESIMNTLTSAQAAPVVTFADGHVTTSSEDALRALATAFKDSFSQNDPTAWSSLDAVAAVSNSGFVQTAIGQEHGAWLISAVQWAITTNLSNRNERASSVDGRIYFAKNENTGCIKIGFTAVAVKRRLAQFQKLTGANCVIVGCIAGHRSLEASIHRRFKHLRSAGEWFQPGDDLLAYIATHAQEVEQ